MIPAQNIFAQRMGMPQQPPSTAMSAQNNLARPVMSQPMQAPQMASGTPQMAAQPMPVQTATPVSSAMSARPGFVPGQIPNVNAPGMPQPGGFAQSPAVQNFMRQRMGMM